MNPIFKDPAREEYNELLNMGEKLEKNIIEYNSSFPLPKKINKAIDFAPKYNAWIHRISMASIWLTLNKAELYFINRPFSIYQYNINKNSEKYYLQDLLRAVQERMMILMKNTSRKTKGPLYSNDFVIIDENGISYADKKVKIKGKRLDLLLLLKDKKHINGPELKKILNQNYDVINKSIRGINKQFKNKNNTSYDLIINVDSGGYAFNSRIFKIKY